MSPAPRTVAEPQLVDDLVQWLAGRDDVTRVAVDGADCLGPARLAQSLIEPLRAAGHDARHVEASSFWRDASVRLEHGREDVESYLGWLDAGALRREVLDPARTRHAYLPTLRDARSNRATRDEPRPLGERDVLLVSGQFLLGLGLPFDRAIHLTAPPEASQRRTGTDLQWTLAAHAEYAAGVHPEQLADVVLRCDRRHPVVRGLPSAAPRR